MKLVIDISEKTYEIIRDMMYFYNPQRSGRAETKEIITAIKQGTPLPKVHGDLIDRSKLLVELECGIRSGNYEEGYEKYPHINDMDDCYDTVKYADTVIKADRGE